MCIICVRGVYRFPIALKSLELRPASIQAILLQLIVHGRSGCYVSHQGTQLVAYISLSVYNMNNVPGSVCVNIETAVSIDKTHRMSSAMKTIAKNLRHRKNKCVIFTQPANTQVAKDFWKGRLTQSKRASMINGVISVFNPKHKIYEDASDMATFFD